MTGRTNALVKLGTAISTLEVGTLVKVNENGAPVEYMIVQQGLPDAMYDASCDGCWLLRKDIAENNRIWDSTNNAYGTSEIHSYLNGDWTSRYEAGILSQIKQVKIPYVDGTGSGGAVASGAYGLSCKMFLLSGYEVGFSTSDNSRFPRDGAKLSYFDSGISSAPNNKRIANYNGTAASWYLRSPYTSGTYSVWSIKKDGGYLSVSPKNSNGLRPAFILSSTALVDDNLNVIPA